MLLKGWDTMKCIREIAQQIIWVGAGDRRLALFENMFPLQDGIVYNSYLIRDGKTALIDTVDASVARQFLENIEAALDRRELDYLVVNHMEPDHCANIEEICRRWPGVKIIGNSKTFSMIQQFYQADLFKHFLEVKEGDELSLGEHTLRFVMAPMVHWPEVMFTLEKSKNILFSADAFGTFGGFHGNLLSDEMEYERLYLDESRRYYTNIVGRFGQQVRAALAKLEGIVPNLICSLHGPVLRGSAIPLMIDKYQHWAAYKPEKRGIVMAYASMYGNTENAVLVLADMLAKKGVTDMRIFDISKTHYSYIIAEFFKYSHIVLAAPTYNAHLYNGMDSLIRDMASLKLQKRKVAVIGNGSWAPAAHAIMQSMLQEMKRMEIVGEPLVILSALQPQQMEKMEMLADQLAASLR